MAHRAGNYVSRLANLGGIPAFTLTADQLAAVVRSAVTEALAELAQDSDPAPLLLDRSAIAEALGCSASQIDRLRRRGLPTERFGDCPRFDLEAEREWIRGQKDKSR
jgi:hypothetical protein